MRIAKIIVIGASTGGIEATCRLLAGLPRDFSPPIFIVQHIGRALSMLPRIFARCGPLPVAHPRQGEKIRSGRIYVAPSNQHLVIANGHMELRSGPRENRSRPAVDPLFRSAARAYREHVIGIILSGELDDGVAGLFAIKARGGTTIVQDPIEAPSPSMPGQALRNVIVDHVSPVAEMAPLLVKLTQGMPMPKTHQKKKAKRRTAQRASAPEEKGVKGIPVPMVCPDCSGPLYELKNGKLVRFHCIVGHSFSPVSLTDAHADALERALWVAIRTLKEKLTLQRMLVNKHGNQQEAALAKRIAEDADGISRDIELLEQVQARI
jgi:two-component system chemotaxis response regulator CheB